MAGGVLVGHILGHRLDPQPQRGQPLLGPIQLAQRLRLRLGRQVHRLGTMRAVQRTVHGMGEPHDRVPTRIAGAGVLVRHDESLSATTDMTIMG
jgi:hypothetical protein